MIEIRRRISTPFSGVSGMPGDRRRPGGRGDERAERPDRGRLAGAVRPEEPEDLALTDLERQVGEGDPSPNRFDRRSTERAGVEDDVTRRYRARSTRGRRRRPRLPRRGRQSHGSHRPPARPAAGPGPVDSRGTPRRTRMTRSSRPSAAARRPTSGAQPAPRLGSPVANTIADPARSGAAQPSGWMEPCRKAGHGRSVERSPAPGDPPSLERRRRGSAPRPTRGRVPAPRCP